VVSLDFAVRFSAADADPTLPCAAVVERTFLFLSERRQQYGKAELKHDAEWIQTHLQVFEVRCA
jgi:hypothetical protein